MAVLSLPCSSSIPEFHLLLLRSNTITLQQRSYEKILPSSFCLVSQPLSLLSSVYTYLKSCCTYFIICIKVIRPEKALLALQDGAAPIIRFSTSTVLTRSHQLPWQETLVSFCNGLLQTLPWPIDCAHNQRWGKEMFYWMKTVTKNETVWILKKNKGRNKKRDQQLFPGKLLHSRSSTSLCLDNQTGKTSSIPFIILTISSLVSSSEFLRELFSPSTTNIRDKTDFRVDHLVKMRSPPE